MQVVIKTTRKHGLEVYECHVNGVNASQHMSLPGARTWARNFIKRCGS